MTRRLLPARDGLTRVIAPFIAVVVAQALIAGFSIYTLSAVRGYVGGESFWSKGQKEAVYFLSLYAETGKDIYYQRYAAAIAVPLADRDARLALQASAPDISTARAGFAGGGNHEADIGGMIWLFRNFSEISYLKRSIEHWTAADPRIVELAGLGQSIRGKMAEGAPSAAQVAAWKQQIFDANEKIRPLARDFSLSLGEGARFIKNMLIALNVATATLLILLGVWRMRKLLVERLAFERALSAERERAEITLASIGDAVISTDIGGRIDYLNPAAEFLLGLASQDARGRRLKSVAEIVETATVADDFKRVAAMLAGQGQDQRLTDRMLRRTDGRVVPVSVMGAPLLIASEVAGGVLVLADMTREQEYVARLSWQASHDMLTGLTNRREFERRLSTALDSIAAEERRHALMYLDLDQFKLVNDTAGHAAGDALLKQVKGLLSGKFRERDTLARLGGDEFALLLDNCRLDEACRIAEIIVASFREWRFAWKNRTFNVGASAGVSAINRACESAAQALSQADVACYTAKEHGRNRVHVYRGDGVKPSSHHARMMLAATLNDALNENRFRLFGQPIVSLKEGDAGPSRNEVLLRLQDDSGTIILPNTFIPAAERYGMMARIDRWVIEQAFRACAATGCVRDCPELSLNLSGDSLSSDDLAEFVLRSIRAHGVRPEAICFEITETAAIRNLDNALRFIDEMRRHGCRIALDDFGSGQSSFHYLRTLPADFLKIDGAFVRNIADDEQNEAVVAAINDIGHKLGIATIAEYVQDAATAERLRRIGVDYAQGHAFGAPRPLEHALLAAAA